MTEDRKKPGWGFWVMVLLVALGTYPLSMGPYWWLCHQCRIPRPIKDVLDTFYDPVWESSWSGPEWIQSAVTDYLHWWTRDQPPIPAD
jgi:hypothetical protein